MAFPIYKPVDNKDFISILFATRGRVEHLTNLLDSLQATVARKDLLDVWAYVDEDDLPTLEVLREPGRYDFPIHCVNGERIEANGEMYNTLRAACTSNPGLYMIISDKVRFLTQGWDAIAREAFDQYPDRILFAFPLSPVRGKDFGAFFLLSAEWANATGRIFTDHFPYWHDDMWLNQLGHLVNRFLPLDFEVDEEMGETKRMENLLFWRRFFENTLDERLQEARRLLQVMSKDEADFEARWAEAQRIARRFEAYPTPERNAQLVQMERHYAAKLRAAQPRSEKISAYRQLEDQAVEHLSRKLIPLGNTRQQVAIERILDNLSHASAAADHLLEAAQSARSRQDATVAAGLLHNMLIRFPNFPEGYVLMGEHMLETGQPDEALALLDFASSLFPAVPDIQRCRGAVLQAKGGTP